VESLINLITKVYILVTSMNIVLAFSCFGCKWTGTFQICDVIFTILCYEVNKYKLGNHCALICSLS